MTKRKTKLVCVGWGIWGCRAQYLWDRKVLPTRKEIIRWRNKEVGGTYKADRRKRLAIAKKLWVEVNE